MKFTEALAVEEQIVEAVQRGCSRLRGEITNLQRALRDLTDDYARLNDQHDRMADARELLIQSAVNWYDERYPDRGEQLNTARWCDLWQSISQPLEMDVRAEMIKRGCKVELWLGLEE